MSSNLSNFYKMFSHSAPSRFVDLSTAKLEEEFRFKIKIVKSSRARRITLRVCQVTGGLRVTIPSNLQISVLRTFLNKNLNWVSSNLKKLSPSVLITDGILLPIQGQNRKILMDANLKSKYLFKETELILPKGRGPFEIHVKSVLKQITCDHYADRLGVTFSKISLKDPKSRWGSCSSDRKLMFSWRLIMAPLEVSSYVVAHEIVHLLHMDHSKKFWTTVGAIYPNYEDQRNWLRENGRKLHKFIF